MAQHEVDAMSVVDPTDRQKVVGLISREDLFRASILGFEEEKQRERVISVSGTKNKERLGRVKTWLERKKPA